MATYPMHVAGLDRDFPICKVTDDLYIGAFIMFGDAELTVRCAEELLKLAEGIDYDYLFTAEAKSIPLIHEMARQSGAKTYFVARKGLKVYMPHPLHVTVRSITTQHDQDLYLSGEEADKMRNHGGDAGEYGATTGRPRRVGWYDCVSSRYGCAVQGATDCVLSVLDCLGYLDEIKVCVGYEINGKVTKDFPVTALLEKAKPVFTALPGWKCDITGITEYDKLPENCRKYIEFIEQEIGFKIHMVSNGPARENIIIKE